MVGHLDSQQERERGKASSNRDRANRKERLGDRREASEIGEQQPNQPLLHPYEHSKDGALQERASNNLNLKERA
ncbi:unnamed protein product [Dovyalis caffra]|uniref:Uncharacterized protein n=1 Tax=Dovyalis caffra TaxID=77055 RepID=A0AAV1SIZ5_9ROSI|nr:unnamed protein product [Dovyalis caffra]